MQYSRSKDSDMEKTTHQHQVRNNRKDPPRRNILLGGKTYNNNGGKHKQKQP